MSDYERFLVIWTSTKMAWVWTIFAVIPAWGLTITLLVLMAVRDGFETSTVVFVIWFSCFTVLTTLMVIDLWYRRLTNKPKFNWIPGKKG